MAPVNAVGSSGASYSFHLAYMSDTWNDVPAIYMFAYWNVTYWHVLYIGQCKSAKDRFAAHERWGQAVTLGATHVLNHQASLVESERKREEQDLIASHKPVMNVQHQPVRGRGLFGLAG